ncbi:phosphoribosylglycinamide formyltransferase [Stenotrophobium rhamnosiphilum]|uniref:Phosphoribosylglycinamide formyltransferase n=1 Tax=Stenotrophobium rhamnosiphilum TaxID=2029166 RepID=A0A2T5MJY6_9GAMM|nr:phosphoribosylglycinamide formyltransferase [Stenotrophobium rhamnosiphilum]PTU32878.1 phosphoribosylglycinamide formyltransferase [Stenotrophobium rhamnosiphilum]
MKNIVVLISGQGRNLQALIEAQEAGRLHGRIAAVASNKADAGGLARAREAGILTEVVPHIDYAERSVFDAALAATIERHHPDIVVMAGFMRVVGDEFTRQFRGRMLNIHPSLLPKYPGLKTHQRALEAGDAEHGATVHFVTEELDGGAPVIQGRLSVEAQDTAQTLGERVMRDIELKIYPQAVAWMARGELKLENEQVWFRGQRRTTPLNLNDLDVEFANA